MMRIFSGVMLVLTLLSLSSCGWIQSLRRDVEEGDDDKPTKKLTLEQEREYYKDPANKYVPPPPATVSDARANMLSGTPVDLSGDRAKRVRITVSDFAAENAKNENSLWAEDGQSNYFFARNKLKSPGDLVTVIIEDQLRKDMVSAVKQTLPPEYREMDIRVPGLTKEVVDTKVAGAAVAASSVAEPGPDDMLTAEILERYQNGNIRLRGIKRIPFKRQVRNLEVVAIVKGAEISEQDVVKSSKFFEQRVELYK